MEGGAECFLQALFFFSKRVSPQTTTGMANIVAAMKRHMSPATKVVEEVLPMRTAEDLAKWEALDDGAAGARARL
jgi:hypothetical protein